MSIPTMLSPHFRRSECACHCCGRIGSYGENLKVLLGKLEALWAYILQKYWQDLSINITCLYRCPKHNAEVGGVENSYHTRDMAADIWVKDMSTAKLAKAAEEVGFGGIGIYESGFVHVDIGLPGRRWKE